MQTLKLQTIFTNNIYSYPEFNQFIGEEVEITIKKIKHKRDNSKLEIISDIQNVVKQYNSEGKSLSEELIKDRRIESKNE
jgi:hypothetical protein